MLLSGIWLADARAETGSIAGTVTSVATGAPIEGAEVCVDPVGWTWDPGQEGIAGGCTETAADGTYLFTNRAVANYQVMFISSDEYRLFREFYDDKPTRATADTVPVESGAAVTGIDAELDSAPRVEGTVVSAEDGLPVNGVEACALSIIDFYAACDWTANDGTYAIEVWFPGEYEIQFAPRSVGRELALQFYDRADRWWDAELLSLDLNETVTGVDAELRPGAHISGRVALGLSNEPLNSVRVCSIDAFTAELWTCDWTAENGAYNLPLLSEGVYKVVFSPDPDDLEWFPEAEMDYDSLPTQYWDSQTTLAAAKVIHFGPAGGSAVGIDAFFGPRPPSITPPLGLGPAPPGPLGVRKCKKGKRLKLVKGKRRCVKAKKRPTGHRSTRTLSVVR